MTEPDPLRVPGEALPHRQSAELAVPKTPVVPLPDFGPSPYQSPAILPDEEQALVWGDDPLPAMPIAASLIFGVVASGLTVAGASASWRIVNVYFPSALFLGPLAAFLGPLVLIGAFVLVAIAFYSSNPLVISKSTGWKILMVLLVPPVSMLVFVPTCVGSTIFIVPFPWRSSLSEWIMLIPFFLAYFVCAAVISRRLRWRFIKRRDPNESTP